MAAATESNPALHPEAPLHLSPSQAHTVELTSSPSGSAIVGKGLREALSSSLHSSSSRPFKPSQLGLLEYGGGIQLLGESFGLLMSSTQP